jgi:tRNA 5-methylaminomethyl-2-thiouridine biosynthesis bifunctional protein
MPRLPPQPVLSWSDEGVPRAAAFDDVYFSRAGGLAESEAVFLNGCGLPDAWSAATYYSICELGFGTGLNVLAAWRAWRRARLPHAVLHIFSIEAFPLAVGDAARALARFPEVGNLTERLLARWPVRTYAPQRLWFEEDGFALTLLTGEAERVLPQMRGQFDAWFLDGFSPARNGALWSETIFREMARLSKPGARAATFTVAGDVRRGLESAEFAVEKKPGFGAKRERLEARFQGAAPAANATPPPKRVAVLGAGIAGASAAAALRRRNVETIVLEAAPNLGAGASGNPAGLVMPRLDRGGGGLSEMFLASYLDAVSTYETLGVFTRCGVEQRAAANGEAALADLLADPPLPEDWMRGLANGAALHARAGLLDPQAAIPAMLTGATLMCDAPVAALEQSGSGWTLRAPDGRAILRADAVVLACGAALTAFAAAKFLPIQLSRGQIEWGAGAAPAHALTRGSYVTPFAGGVLFGATFDKVEDGGATPAAQSDGASRARNIDALRELAPEVAASVDESSLRSRASLRATTPDRAPVVGALPDAAAWLAQNADVAHGRAPAHNPTHAGVYVFGGLGARGLTLAPLMGECLIASVFNEPSLLSAHASEAINPARFLHRALKRRAADSLG